MRVSLYFCENDLYDCPDEYILPKIDLALYNSFNYWLALLSILNCHKPYKGSLI